MEPLPAEAEWLAEHDLSFPSWVLTRLREQHREGEEAKVSWASFQRRLPALARAAARFLASAGLSLPSGAPRG